MNCYCLINYLLWIITRNIALKYNMTIDATLKKLKFLISIQKKIHYFLFSLLKQYIVNINSIKINVSKLICLKMSRPEKWKMKKTTGECLFLICWLFKWMFRLKVNLTKHWYISVILSNLPSIHTHRLIYKVDIHFKLSITSWSNNPRGCRECGEELNYNMVLSNLATLISFFITAQP